MDNSSGNINRVAGDWQKEILTNRDKAKSVKEISAQFKGTSKIETLEANQKRVRTYRKIPSLSMFGMDNHNQIKALTSPNKINLMSKWSETVRDKRMGEVSVESARDFLAHYGVTKDEVDNTSWEEWMEAIDTVTTKSPLPLDTSTDGKANDAALTRENSDANFRQLGALGPLAAPSNSSSTYSSPGQTNSASGYWSKDKLFPEQDQNMTRTMTMESHSIPEETQETVAADADDEEDVHPYTAEDDQDPRSKPDVTSIDLASDFAEAGTSSGVEHGGAEVTLDSRQDEEALPESEQESKAVVEQSTEAIVETSPLLSSAETAPVSPSTSAPSSQPLQTHNPLVEEQQVVSDSTPLKTTLEMQNSSSIDSPKSQQMDRSLPAPSSKNSEVSPLKGPVKKSSCLCC